MNSPTSNLVILVADKNMKFTVKGLLTRPEALGIRCIDCKIFVHPHNDPGCLLKSHTFLSSQANLYAHALVMFDRFGCGQDQKGRDELENEVTKRLSINGWENRAAAVVIDPELEQWVWVDSPNVASCLTWSQESIDPRSWLQKEGLWEKGKPKPVDPKEALERCLKEMRKPRTSALFEQLAKRVGLRSCKDQAFKKFKATLQTWFPEI